MPDPWEHSDPRPSVSPGRHAAGPTPSGYPPQPVFDQAASRQTQQLPTVEAPYAAVPGHPAASSQRYSPAPARKTSWPLLADDLFRLAHDGARLRVDRDLAGAGLACAVIAELAVTGHVTVDNDLLVVTDQRPPQEALAHTVLTEIASQPQPLPVLDWLRYLSARPTAPTTGRADIYHQVAQRLVRSGDLLEVPRRRLLFGPPRVVYEPTSNNRAYWACARLNTAAEHGRELDEFDRVLVGLCLSTGVYQRVFSSPAHVIDRLCQDSRRTRHPVPDLLRHLDRLVSNTITVGV
ncbi:GOLPH3/VPS74 family protein [Actinoplanes octamycinicus]|uniref:GOLPH3/VPS74 family protein n=1 Tax=Actinoplanes octamycinicus TaxID=135948 RepID=UPI00160B4A9C|nr:GPP34 family phosphoprotein [Actinoplanes octamycinicus]